MSELLKSRHAFGSTQNIDSAMDQGLIDAYDILFLDGDSEPKIGWVDKNGVLRLVENKGQVVHVNQLPTTGGEENVIYIYNNEGYIWNGTECVSLSKSANLTTLENQVNALETQLQGKVDASTVQNMIQEYTETEVIEF